MTTTVTTLTMPIASLTMPVATSTMPITTMTMTMATMTIATPRQSYNESLGFFNDPDTEAIQGCQNTKICSEQTNKQQRH